MQDDNVMKRERKTRLWRYPCLGLSAYLLAGACLPDGFFPYLVGSAISAVASVILSDIVNLLIPPIA